MMDQYKEQYKKETEQIHAPADLIARTKAAVREEEARLQRERAVQTTKAIVQEAESVTQETFPAQKKESWGAVARKWAYPLTIVAAIFILLSVSLMMRGLGKSSSDSASYELASGADSGGEESVPEAAFEAAAPEAALASEEAAEEAAEGMASDREAASVTEEFAPDRETNVTGGITDLADETKRDAAADEAAPESGMIEDAMSQKQEAITESEVQTEDITITKVSKKPAFVDRADVEIRTYRDTAFQLIKEGENWAAYVEDENGVGYVIRGKTETVEAFLEAGYRELFEIGY